MSTLSATVDLPVSVYTVRDARTLTLALAAAWDSRVSLEDLALLVDDLTADVVGHAAAEASLVLELSLADQLLRVGLADGTAVRPVADDVTQVGPSWALAHRWGDEPYQDGHRVWFELVPPLDVDGPADVALGAEGLAAFAAALAGAARAVDDVDGVGVPPAREVSAPELDTD